jgi:hypothetical protein
MRAFGSLHPTEQIPVIPDTMGSFIISSAGAVITTDWPAGAEIVAFSGEGNFYVNWLSTGARVPTTNSSGTTLSSDANELNPSVRQIPGASTGYSLTGASSGVVTAAFWGK